MLVVEQLRSAAGQYHPSALQDVRSEVVEYERGNAVVRQTTVLRDVVEALLLHTERWTWG